MTEKARSIKLYEQNTEEQKRLRHVFPGVIPHQVIDSMVCERVRCCLDEAR